MSINAVGVTQGHPIMTNRIMRDQSRFESQPGPDRPSRRERNLLLTLLALVLVVALGLYVSIPKKEEHTTVAPDPTGQTIHELQTSLQQTVDQLRALQQTVSSDRAETTRLSDQVNALSDKIEALQQSFASSQRAPVVLTEPAAPKRPPITPLTSQPVRGQPGAR